MNPIEKAIMEHEKMLTIEEKCKGNKKIRDDAAYENWAKSNRSGIEEALQALRSMQKMDVDTVRSEVIQHGSNCFKLEGGGFLYCDVFGGIRPAAASKVAANTFDHISQNYHLIPKE